MAKTCKDCPGRDSLMCCRQPPLAVMVLSRTCGKETWASTKVEGWTNKGHPIIASPQGPRILAPEQWRR